MGTDIRAQLDSMMDEYRATTARLAEISTELAAVAATATSTDRCVSVTVGAHGELTRLTIDANAAARLDARALAGRILEAAGLATAQVRKRVTAMMSATLPESVRAIVEPDGTLDLTRLLPHDPGAAGDLARLRVTR